MQRMKIVLATGIYPPDIGGPATYVHNLAQQLMKQGVDVTVVTYAHPKSEIRNPKSETRVICVDGRVPIIRWILYARALRKCAKNADIVYAFSSVSCGVPLFLASLKKPKKILRLGGDFLWERYTDRGGRLGLREWYKQKNFVTRCSLRVARGLLYSFDHLVFSTKWQEGLYEEFYKKLPQHSVIENAIPDTKYQIPNTQKLHTPFRLLFMGRFVGFKNLENLIKAVDTMNEVQLTFVGSGPMAYKIQNTKYKILFPILEVQEKQKLFSEHDVLIIPSITEISPNVALEARSSGMPVLLTEETGLSEQLRQGMVVRPMRTPEKICNAILEVMEKYEKITEEAAKPFVERSWSKVCEEHIQLFSQILSSGSFESFESFESSSS